MAPASPTSQTPPPFDCDARMLRVGVYARMQALGLHQQEVAAQTKLSEPILSRFLRGRERPSDQTVNRLIHWLELPMAHFQAEQAEPRRAVPAA
jgi:transcriptional regulator with XRE-family HTH domain